LLYQPEQLTDPNVDILTLYSRLLMKLDCLQTEFFIDRLLLRKGHPGSEAKLLATSFEAVSVTLGLWTHMDRFAAMTVDFEWLVSGQPG
jgi:hypothetical protein